jgi:hypothetical protein
MSAYRRSLLLVTGGFLAGSACSFVGLTFAATAPAPAIPSSHAYLVSIDEIRQNIASAEPFAGSYTRTVTMSDGSTREITLRPELLDGKEVVEVTDQSSNGKIDHSVIGSNGTTINDMLMIRVTDSPASKMAADHKKTAQ